MSAVCCDALVTIELEYEGISSRERSFASRLPLHEREDRGTAEDSPDGAIGSGAEAIAGRAALGREDVASEPRRIAGARGGVHDGFELPHPQALHPGRPGRLESRI